MNCEGYAALIEEKQLTHPDDLVGKTVSYVSVVLAGETTMILVFEDNYFAVLGVHQGYHDDSPEAEISTQAPVPHLLLKANVITELEYSTLRVHEQAQREAEQTKRELAQLEHLQKKHPNNHL